MESNFVGNQMRFENSAGKVLSLKILAFEKLVNLRLSGECGFRTNAETLFPAFTEDFKGSQTYSDASVLFEISGDQVPSLKILALKNIKSSPTASECGFGINAECLRLTFTDDSKCAQAYSDPSVLLVNNGDCVASLKVLALKKLESLPSFGEYPSSGKAEILCSSPVENSEKCQTDSDSFDESYYTCMSDEDEEYFDLEPVITLKFPEKEIVMKKVEFLDHCFAVRSGAKRPSKSKHVLIEDFAMDTYKIENTVQHNLIHRRKANGVRAYSDKDSQKKELLDHCKAVKSGAKRPFKSRHVLKQNIAMDTSKNMDREQHNLMLSREKGVVLVDSDEDNKNEIAMKKKELLDHCDAVKSGAKQRLKNRRVLRQNFVMEACKNDDIVQRKLMLHHEEGGVLIYSDNDSKKNNDSSEYTAKQVCNLVNYFDSIVN